MNHATPDQRAATRRLHDSLERAIELLEAIRQDASRELRSECSIWIGVALTSLTMADRNETTRSIRRDEPLSCSSTANTRAPKTTTKQGSPDKQLRLATECENSPAERDALRDRRL